MSAALARLRKRAAELEQKKQFDRALEVYVQILDEGGKDLFVHHSGINANGFKSLPEGANVSYDAEAGDKGPKAVNVTQV